MWGEPSPPSPALTKILTRSNMGVGVAADLQASLAETLGHGTNAKGCKLDAIHAGEQLLRIEVQVPQLNNLGSRRSEHLDECVNLGSVIRDAGKGQQVDGREQAVRGGQAEALAHVLQRVADGTVITPEHLISR